MRAAVLAGMFLGALAFAAVTPAGAHLVADPREPRNELCSGDAPVKTSCTTGNHTRLLGMEIEMYPEASYSGVIRILLTPKTFGAPTAFDYRCAFDDGQSKGCAFTGLLPPRGVPFDMDCSSHDLPGNLDPFAATQLGGDGLWFCEIRHV